MSNPLFRCRKEHPCRPPYWRWERARLLKELKQRAPGRGGDDRLVLSSWRLQLSLDQARDDIERYQAYSKAGNLGLAYDVWDEGEGKDPGKINGCRHELEARLLARQPVETIAQRLSLDKPVVHTYEQVFFNVTDRLDNPGYILHQVIGPQLHQGMTDKHFPVLLKAYAYFSQSPELVDAMTTTFMEGQSPRGRPDLFLTADSRWTTCRKAALAARMVPLNAFTQAQILELNQQMLASDRESGAAPVDSFQANVSSMLAGISFLVGRQGERLLDRPAELRAAEVLAMAAGQPLPAIEHYADFSYPEVKDAQ